MSVTAASGAAAATPAAFVILGEPRMLAQVGTLARRSVRRTLRQPAAIFPSILLPLILLAINASGLDDASKIPGFPAGATYLDFAFAMPFMQAALFATINAGSGLARDIEEGFLNRLALTPMRGSALVLGQLAGAVVVTLIASASYLLYGILTGVEVDTGPLGVAMLVLLGLLVSLAFASLGALIALKAGNGEVVQGVFPLLFVVFFLSSVAMPRDVMPIEWFRTVATWNPISYMVEAMRAPVIVGWDWSAIGAGAGVAALMTAITLVWAGRALSDWLVRT